MELIHHDEGGTYTYEDDDQRSLVVNITAEGIIFDAYEPGEDQPIGTTGMTADEWWDRVVASVPRSSVEAGTKFVAGDVTSLRQDWTEDRAEEWLSENATYIADAMVAAGWNAIETLLPMGERTEEE